MKAIDDFIKYYHLQTVDSFLSDNNSPIPVIQEPSILKEYLYEIGLIGARIDSISIIEQWGFDGIAGSCNEEKVMLKEVTSIQYNAEEDKILCHCKPEFPLLYPRPKEYMADFIFDTLIDPVIINTDRGVYIIEYDESSSVIIEKSPILPSSRLTKEKRLENFSQLFSCIKGQQIVACSVDEQTYDQADDSFTCPAAFGLQEGFPAYIKRLNLILENGRRISFSSCYDDGEISLRGSDGKPVKLHVLCS